MKNNISAAAVIFALSLSAAYAADTLQKADKKKSGSVILKTDKAVVLPSQELKWADVPEFPGVKSSFVEGDAKAGAHHAYFKFPAGFNVPAHHHTADHYTTIVSGNVTLTVDGQDFRLGPGSYFSFVSKTKHATRCESGADCVMFLDTRGAWDVIPEKAAKAGR